MKRWTLVASITATLCGDSSAWRFAATKSGSEGREVSCMRAGSIWDRIYINMAESVQAESIGTCRSCGESAR